jgi:hypothetical protein
VRGPCHAHRAGFDLHAGLVVPARDRARLERTCRYALRPPVAADRLRLTQTGQVLLALRHRWRDGTTHLLFDPIELLERLAALTPRPRVNLVLYYGVLAAHAAWRSRLQRDEAGRGPAAQPMPAPRRGADGTSPTPAEGPTRPVRQRSNVRWAQLMARSSRLRQGFGGPRRSASRRRVGYDVLVCARCGGGMRLLALIEQASLIARILTHLGLPTDVPAARPPRAPPLPSGTASRWADDDLP